MSTDSPDQNATAPKQAPTTSRQPERRQPAYMRMRVDSDDFDGEVEIYFTKGEDGRIVAIEEDSAWRHGKKVVTRIRVMEPASVGFQPDPTIRDNGSPNPEVYSVKYWRVSDPGFKTLYRCLPTPIEAERLLARGKGEWTEGKVELTLTFEENRHGLTARHQGFIIRPALGWDRSIRRYLGKARSYLVSGVGQFLEAEVPADSAVQASQARTDQSQGVDIDLLEQSVVEVTTIRASKDVEQVTSPEDVIREGEELSVYSLLSIPGGIEVTPLSKRADIEQAFAIRSKRVDPKRIMKSYREDDPNRPLRMMQAQAMSEAVDQAFANACKIADGIADGTIKVIDVRGLCRYYTAMTGKTLDVPEVVESFVSGPHGTVSSTVADQRTRMHRFVTDVGPVLGAATASAPPLPAGKRNGLTATLGQVARTRVARQK